MNEIKRLPWSIPKSHTRLLRINWNKTTFHIHVLPVFPSICRLCEKKKAPSQISRALELRRNIFRVKTTTSRSSSRKSHTTQRRGHLRVAISTVPDPSGSGRVDLLTSPVAAARAAVATGAWVKSKHGMYLIRGRVGA